MKRKLHLEHPHIEEESGKDDSTTTTTPKNRGPILIDMQKVMTQMRSKLVGEQLSSGFVVYGSDRLNTIANQQISQFNQQTMEELKNDLASGSFPARLNAHDISSCHTIYTTEPSIKNSSEKFKNALFKQPFDVIVTSSNDEEGDGNNDDQTDQQPQYGITEDVRNVLVKHFWMPSLRSHYDWIKKWGICPIYYEPIGIRQKDDANKIVIHYVMTVPQINSGAIYTYLNRKNKQCFIWEWFNGGSTTLLTNATGSGLDGNNNTFFGLGGLLSGGIINDFFGPNASSLIINRSRYILFDTYPDWTPNLNGTLQSSMKSLVGDWLLLKRMEEQTLAAGAKMINPECIVECHPDLKAASEPAALESNKLQLEFLKIKMRSQNVLDTYSSTFGQTIPGAMDNDPIANNLMDEFSGMGGGPDPHQTRYGAITQERARVMTMASSTIVSDSNLGLSNYDARLQPLPSRSPATNQLDFFSAYASNNPNSEMALAMRSMSANSFSNMLQPNNIRKLEMFEKVSSSSPKVTLPGYDLKGMYEWFESIASNACDYPIEMLKTGGKVGGSSGGDSSSSMFGSGGGSQNSTQVSTQQTLFSANLLSISNRYENLIQLLWGLSYSFFVKNTERAFKKQRRQEQNSPQQLLANISIDSIRAFDRIQVTIPIMPFVTFQEAMQFYEVGILNEEGLWDFVVNNYGIPGRYHTKQRKKEILGKMVQKYQRQQDIDQGLIQPKEVLTKKDKKKK